MNSVLSRPLAFVDIETTGGSHFSSRVLELGVVRVEAGKVVATYQTLVHPDEQIPPFITGLTGITDAHVAESPRFAQVADELADILEGAVFVAHNVRFDYSFLKMEFDRLGVSFRPQLLCTVRLSRRLYPQFRTHKLADLIVRHGLDAPSRHRAYDDAHCLWQFLQLCTGEFGSGAVDEALRSQLQAPSIPSQLDRRQVEQLPEGPGVYIFEDTDGAPLYVGKSVNVKRRVMSHFAADHSDSGEMRLAAQVKSLRGIATHGELGALLMESELVKELQPKYNRTLRHRELMTLAVAETTPAGYNSLRLLDAGEIAADEGPRILAVYSSPARAKEALHRAAATFRLCSKLMGLEHSRRACFGSQIGRCGRACVGEEAIEDYNRRFEEAFGRNRVAVWPYRGPVLIREQQAGMEGAAGYLVDNWCLLGRLRELEDGSVEVLAGANSFDLDSYKIIRKYLENPINRHSVSALSRAEVRQLLQPA